MLGLAEVVQNLRRELYAAMSAADKEALQFYVGDITLELSVAVSREGGASGKVRFWVVDVGAEGKLGSSSVQKLSLKLTPQVGDGDAPLLISGDAVSGEGTGGQSANG